MQADEGVRRLPESEWGAQGTHPFLSSAQYALCLIVIQRAHHLCPKTVVFFFPLKESE